MTRSSCHDTQRNYSRPYLTILPGMTPKRRLPGRERPDSRGFRHFFVYIAHFPQKSKLYGEKNWYIRHSGGLILGQVVNVPTSFKWWAGGPAKKARQISRRSPDWGRNTAPCPAP